jgi:MATE family multidrug resistance protein
VFNAAVFLMGLIGTASLAAHQIAIQIASLSFMIPMGLAQAVTVRVGHAYGRRDPVAIARAGWTSFVMATRLHEPHGTGHVADPPPPRVDLPRRRRSANAAVIPLAVAFLGVAALVPDRRRARRRSAPACCAGSTIPRCRWRLRLFGYWVAGMGTAVALGFGLGWGGVGIWAGLAAGLAVVAVLMLVRWSRRERLGLVAGAMPV